MSAGSNQDGSCPEATSSFVTNGIEELLGGEVG